MITMKKLISTNKRCTYHTMAMIGAGIGMVAAKVLIKRCCCAEKLKSKAKRALKTMEERFLD